MAGLTMREEITVLTLLFLFSIVTIPIILLSSGKENHIVKKTINESPMMHFYQMSFRDKSAMNIVKIVESKRNSINGVKIGVDIFQNIDTVTFFQKYHAILPKQRYFMNSSRDEIAKIWAKFNFINKTQLISNRTIIPLKVDWREKGVVSRVKEQRACGACWAYSTIGMIESISAIKTGKLSELSVSQMIECNDENMDCNGGDPNRLLKWLYDNQINIISEDEFQYLENKCEDSKTSGVKILDFSFNNFTDNEHLMLLYMAYFGPIVTTVNAINWPFYANNIIQQNCNESLKFINHAVEIVGYDMTEKVPFYIVKNSWGPHFGIDGYLKIAIGSNLCGIAERVSTVLVK